ncbi:hypothetical protein NQ317_008257 [Molorchus minor]|uniref:Band 3 cytoplasmic domain-containing protein n=1 Tax=Molorchus minor TaxID=1323400 RepID=A0ABQ9JTV8_9CUCU|nr:hypothetical protein NQ317_008257 [Molorchus minor]
MALVSPKPAGTPPSQRVQFILGEDINDEKHESHPLFSEMEELVFDGDEMEWKETARWIKFEEDVEEGGNRWSKPHVATLSLHSLFELRSLLLNGTVCLDMEATSIEQIADLVLDNMINNKSLNFDNKDKVREALLKRHRHQHQRKNHGLPFIRSFNEMRNHSTSKRYPIFPHYVADQVRKLLFPKGVRYWLVSEIIPEIFNRDNTMPD